MANVSSSNGLEKRPKLRFQGFDEPWKEVAFSQLYRYVSEKNDGTIGTDRVISVANMYFKPDARVSSADYLKTYNLFRHGDIAFEGNKSKNFAFGRFVENTIGDGIVSHVFTVFRPIASNHNLDYWSYAINNENVMGRILSRCTKKTTMMTNLVIDDFLVQKICCPSEMEQQRIAGFLKKIDDRIEKQTTLIETLKKYKRGLVKALISGTVAFDGSEHERWETVSLAEIFTISAGGDIDRQNSSPSCSTSYPYPVYANALTNNGLYGYANYFKVKGDSITVSGRGEVGHAIARHRKYVPIVRLLSLVPKYGDDVDFFAYMINATSIYIESTGVPQLTSPQLGAVKVLRPPICEQKRLSSLLMKMDAKLENEERLTFYMEKIRAFMLQQLFI